GDANYSSSLSTHFARGGKPDGESCTSPSDCLGGYCVHGICRSSSTYCGDNYCDSGEDCASCSADCGACPMPSLPPPPKPPEEKPPVAVPAAPVIWPQPCSGWIAGKSYPIPKACSITLVGELIDGKPADGTVAILVYGDSMVVNNLSAITPTNLNCNQKPLSAYEINMTADIINYCMNYKGKLGDINESTLSVWQLSEGKWQELPSDMILHDTNIICANITSAQTPYMIAGFVPVVGITPEVALAAIQKANATIAQAEAAGKNIEIARQLLVAAEKAYLDCKYGDAKDLADRAMASIAGLPIIPIIIIAAIGILAILIAIAYWTLRMRVKPKMAVSSAQTVTEQTRNK
ncbi:MAG: DUF4398 domain-containing protein, partial [Candidatus Aenigmatarchaeota archaeon]